MTLMVKTMVSGENVPNKTNPLIIINQNILVDNISRLLYIYIYIWANYNNSLT